MSDLPEQQQNQIQTVTPTPPQQPSSSETPEEDIIPAKLTPKLEKWIELFLDKANKTTYGNMTESAMQAYDCTNRVSAASLGHQNFRKLQVLASAYADGRGMTFGTLMDIAIARMVEDKGTAWWDRVMEMTGYKQMTPLVQVNNTQNTQYNLNAPEVVDFNKQFKKFLEQQ